MGCEDLRLSGQALAGQLDAALSQVDAGGGSAWSRGWVLAALGRYGDALDALDAAETRGGPVAAAACATRASVLRQVGLHARAEQEDLRGLAFLEEGDHLETRSGLLIGLVADGVGGGRPAETLDAAMQAAAEEVALGGSTRQRVRLDWVTGEAALAGGQASEAAMWFQRARRRAVDEGMRRHEAKSLVLLAAANAAAGDRRQAAALARDGLAAATACGAEPLRWRSLLVLAETTGDPVHRAAAEDVRSSLRERLPADLRADAWARPPAAALLP